MSDGTFRPGGVTAWSAYNTPRIWAMVEPEDDPESWRQVAALGSMAGLLHDQRKRLEAAREGLIQAWPPEKNPAAQAFVEMIDDLLANMRRNKEIADTNAGALSQVLETLRQAKADIAPLYQAYVEKSDDWVPAWWDGAEDEIDEQARRRMREAEEIIAHPDNTIRVPQVYELRPDFTRSRIDDEDSDGDKLSAGGRAGPSGAGAGSAFPVPHEPPPPLPGRDARVPGEASPATPSGPELAGVLTPPAASGGLLPSVGPPAAVPAPAAVPGLVIGGALPLPSSPPRVGGPAGGARPGRGGGFGLSPGAGPLGGPPRGGGGSKPATPSWLPPASGQPARPGATGQPARGGSSTGRGGVGAPMMPMTGGRRSPEEHGSAMTFDPDNPWATAEGVDPVIAPSERTYRHDPGPWVIGWQR